ncbi:MAG: tRNA 2-selenouridine, partial [Chitinophagaceae bacterium]
GAAVIDLEGLAHHKGSAFGAIGQPAQPSQEFFENQLAMELWQLSETLQPGSPIYLEDESQRIGLVNIPTVFFQQMRQQKVCFLEIPFDERLDFIVANYGKFEKEKLINAVIRVKKKLGGLETKMAVNALIEDDIRLSFAVMLKYYDKLYNKGLLRREDPNSQVKTIVCNTVDADVNAAAVMRLSI